MGVHWRFLFALWRFRQVPSTALPLRQPKYTPALREEELTPRAAGGANESAVTFSAHQSEPRRAYC